jgi:hypothetical protein
VAPVVRLVGTGHRGGARGRSDGARLGRRGDRGGGAYRRVVGWGGGADGVDGALWLGERWPARREDTSAQ